MLQNDFERWSEEYFSEIVRQCGILIQESAPSDSNLAHYWPIGSSLATFATQSARCYTYCNATIPSLSGDKRTPREHCESGAPDRFC
jgi:hypothetical protein